MSYVLAALGFAVLIILHEAGHFAAAKAVGMRVERFSLFFGPMVLKRRRGETEYGIGVLPLGGYVKITGMNPNEEIAPEVAHRAYFRQAVWKRIVVIAAGPAVNLVLAFLILWGFYLTQGTERQDPQGHTVVTRRVAEALEQPAASVLRPGDRIVAIDGRGGSIEEISAQTARHRCARTPTDGCVATTPAHVVVERDGRPLAFDIRPRYSAEAKRTLIGFGFAAAIRSVGAAEAAHLSVAQMWGVTTGTVSALVKRFTEPGNRDLHGVVGGYKVAQKSFAFDTTRALFVLALISLSLAVVNLFPFLPLDGGHIFWAVAEKIRGRPIPFRILERVGAVGFVLIILLAFVGFSNDLYTLNHGGFKVR